MPWLKEVSFYTKLEFLLMYSEISFNRGLETYISYLDLYSAWDFFKKPKRVADNYLNWWLIKSSV